MYAALYQLIRFIASIAICVVFNTSIVNAQYTSGDQSTLLVAGQANDQFLSGQHHSQPLSIDTEVWSLKEQPAMIGNHQFSSVSANHVPFVGREPANRSANGADLLSPFSNRFTHGQLNRPAAPNLDSIPPSFSPWWFAPVTQAVGDPEQQLGVSLDVLIHTALVHSPHIQIAATEPHIRQTNVYEEDAQFDWSKFLETKYDDTNDPIGNELTTGNNEDRFRQKEWFGRGGFRRRNRNGGEIEVAQRVGYLDNNSRFLIPPDQASSRLELNYRQPLLRGRGEAVNESLILLADIDFNRASDELMEELQSHLTEVTATYWELVRARSRYFQRRKLLFEAEKVLKHLEGRKEVDSLLRQIYRARAAVANRRAEIARSWTSIKNAESRLRLLVNEPSLVNATNMEFTPLELPSLEAIPVELPMAVATAIRNRPDISQAIRDLRSAHVLLGVADNDLLPKLDLLMGTYVAGLRGSSDVVKSWIQQFSESRPGFNFGLEYEIPIGNRAASSRLQRRQWELTKTMHEFRAIVETGLNEVELSVREIQTTHQEMNGRYESMIAAANETNYLLDRWTTLPNLDDSVTLLLEDLLDAQERLADEEESFSRAQFDYSVSVVELKKAMGTLISLTPN